MFNGPFPVLLGWTGTRKVKPIGILLKQQTVSGSGISWAICKSAPHSIQITMPAPHHSVLYRPDALADVHQKAEFICSTMTTSKNTSKWQPKPKTVEPREYGPQGKYWMWEGFVKKQHVMRGGKNTKITDNESIKHHHIFKTS